MATFVLVLTTKADWIYEHVNIKRITIYQEELKSALWDCFASVLGDRFNAISASDSGGLYGALDGDDGDFLPSKNINK